jgi:hypothetical protein
MMPNAVIILMLLLAGRISPEGAVILHQPTTQHEYVGFNVSFLCIGMSSYDDPLVVSIKWSVNNSISHSMLSTTIKTRINETTVMSQLIVPGLAEYNNTVIRCQFHAYANGDRSEDVESDLSYIILQGVINDISDLRVEVNPNNTALSWTPPHTLSGLDINYTIKIEASGFSTVVLSDLSNIDSFAMSTDNVLTNICTNYSFSVQPWNAVGAAGVTHVWGYYPGGPVAPSTYVQSDVYFDPDYNTLLTNITIPVTTSCYDKQSVEISLTSSMSQVYPVTITDNTSDDITVTITGLPLNHLILARLTLSNPYGRDYLNGISINTYELQSFDITSTSMEMTCFQCHFIDNSLIKGCNIVLLTPACSVNQKYSLNISHSSNDTNNTGCIDDVIAGNYTVHVTPINQHDENHLNNISTTVQLMGISTCSPAIDPSISTIITRSDGLISSSSDSNIFQSPGATGITTNPPNQMTIVAITIVVFVIVIISSLSVIVVVFICTKYRSRKGTFTQSINDIVCLYRCVNYH